MPDDKKEESTYPIPKHPDYVISKRGIVRRVNPVQFIVPALDRKTGKHFVRLNGKKVWMTDLLKLIPNAAIDEDDPEGDGDPESAA